MKKTFFEILTDAINSQKLLLPILFIFVSIYSYSQDESINYISFSATKDGFEIVSNKICKPIVIASEEYSGVKKTAALFQNDIKKVTRIAPQLFFNEIPKSKEIIIVGTIGRSSLIDKLISKGKLDVKDIKDNWDNSLIQVVEQPFEGVDKALVIVGSNKRGTIYGMFDISRKIGVSPWYWWADVPIQEHQQIYVKKGRYNLGAPKVKYRGIFLNDEEPALGRWAVEKYGGFNHQFYEKVFELLLRLKGNYLWPAMWWASFNSNDSINPKLADEMGIVMGTSHHEPMMRAHAEWKTYGGGAWNYNTNAEQLKKFWKEGIQRMGNYESIVTIAMRGDGDLAMSTETNTSLLENIVKDQRKIIADVTGESANKTPQLWALYKEVQEYYDKGMRVPDDVTLLLCDDNWGNIRNLPKVDSEPRSGGYGIYYHFDFVGGPRNYKWLNTNPIPRIWEQMHLAYKYGVDRIWLVNVGDLKPMELPISFFLDYAWDPDKIPASKLNEYTTSWAQEQFGKEYAPGIAEILRLYTKYNSRRKPESLFSDTYSLINYNEFEKVVEDYNLLQKKAKEIYDKMPPNHKDAFYQLVYHPVLSCSNLNALYLAHAKNIMYAKQGRAATNDMAQEVKNLFCKDAKITQYYHTQLANGKWNHMMAQTHIGYTNWQQPDTNKMPEVKEIELPEKGTLCFTIEGCENVWPKELSQAKLPNFDSFNKQKYYIELFNTGKTALDYQLSASNSWVIISEHNGKLNKQTRISISIDWDNLKTGLQRSILKINSGGKEYVIELIAQKFAKKVIKQAKGFIENNGCISIEAQDYSRAINSNKISWEIIPGLGRTKSGVCAMPVTEKVEKTGAGSPSLEYDFYLLEKPKNGKLAVNIYLSPTLNFLKEKGLHYAVSIDDEPLQLINMHEETEIADWKYPDWWNQAVLNNIIIKTSQHVLNEQSRHVLKFWRVDPGIVLQKIVIDAGGLKFSYLGPPESLKIN